MSTEYHFRIINILTCKILYVIISTPKQNRNIYFYGIYKDKENDIMNKIYEYETRMWEAARHQDPESFLELVSEDAVMVCGGYRCSGLEYADIIKTFDCKDFFIDNFEIVYETDSAVQVQYLIEISVNDPANEDLSGLFNVTTTWIKKDNEWKAVFNMNQRIMG